jgi:hypothetical protein
MMKDRKMDYGLRIIRMVQFINLGSIIFHNMSMPRKIIMVAPIWVIKI